MEKNFILSPPSARLEPGYQLELKCTSPDSLPKAKQWWQKNGQNLTSSSSMTLTQEGSLIIHSVKLFDSGNYTCVAENVAGKRFSDPVVVVVRNEKRWSEWSMCGKNCRKTRQRNCKARSQDDCQEKEVEVVDCNDGSCQQKHIPIKNDRIVYISLITVSILCVVLAALFAHSRRKKPETPDSNYIVTDNGK